MYRWRMSRPVAIVISLRLACAPQVMRTWPPSTVLAPLAQSSACGGCRERNMRTACARSARSILVKAALFLADPHAADAARRALSQIEFELICMRLRANVRKLPRGELITITSQFWTPVPQSTMNEQHKGLGFHTLLHSESESHDVTVVPFQRGLASVPAYLTPRSSCALNLRPRPVGKRCSYAMRTKHAYEVCPPETPNPFVAV